MARVDVVELPASAEGAAVEELQVLYHERDQPPAIVLQLAHPQPATRLAAASVDRGAFRTLLDV